MKELVIFDLDGTLINTIADLAHSTNYSLNMLGYPTHDTDSYRFMVGNGINKLFERALPEEARNESNILKVRQLFLPYYNTHNTDASTPYNGIYQLLKELQKQNILLAVASNKYHEATCKLIKYYFPEISFTAILGQREGIPPKPDPYIVNEIIAHTQTHHEKVLYVGDSGVDMLTASKAGVDACGVTWGFRPYNELNVYSPTHIVDNPMEIYTIATGNTY